MRARAAVDALALLSYRIDEYLNMSRRTAVVGKVESSTYVEPPCAPASAVFKRRGRWYAKVPCPQCAEPLRVKLSLGPMVARCDDCKTDVEADVSLVVTAGRA